MHRKEVFLKNNSSGTAFAMHICYIGDAGSIHVIKWAGYFVEKGHRVSIISDVENRLEGADVFNIGECLPGIHVKYLSATYQIYKKARAIKDILKRLKPHLIHAHYATNYGFLAALSGYHPLVLTIHGSDLLKDYYKDRVSRFFVTYALKRADIITAPSTFIGEKVRAIVQKNPVILQYGIDISRFRRMDNQPNPVREKTIINTRYLTSKYDVETLIKTLPLILARLPEVRFIIVGEGDKRALFEDVIKRAGYSDRVEFKGGVPNEEMPDLLNRASLYISTSPSDGLSISLLEAMACGLFPVVTDIPGNREVITHGRNGLLFSPGDVNGLVEAVTVAIEAGGMRESAIEINRRMVEERFSLTKNLSRVEEIYDRLVGS